ncbi:MAG: mechanosensitive ion channel [bacterium]|nr:mechanosensitive ion channel [bacterium]
MRELIREGLSNLGVVESASETVTWLVAALIIILLAVLSHLITRRILLTTVAIVVRKSKTKWDDVLVERKFFRRIAHLAPAMVVYATAHYLPEIETLLIKFSNVYMLFVGVMAVSAFLSSVNDIYQGYEISKGRPIKGYIQVVKIIVFVMVGISVFASLIGKSPLAILGGVGAMSAVMLLIFKDSILGLVAGIQLSANDMVRVGDWIEMPKFGADGDVIDLSLNTVQVQNWDKTIVSIPAYGLISDSFKNWRGMEQSGGRRIKRAINIDMTSVRFCDEEMLQRFKRFEYLKDYISVRQSEIDQHNKEKNIDNSELVNGRRMTNLGTFRAYLVAYLKSHPKIHQEMTFLVRHLSPTEKGLPIEIYVFSNDQAWANYEAIMADIFDHLLAVIPRFDLRVFQNPTGQDWRRV